MEDIAAMLPGGVLILNADHEILYLNPFGYQLLTYEPGSLTGKRVDVLLTTASRIYVQTNLYPVLDLGQLANERHLTLKTKSGVRVPVLLNASYRSPVSDQRHLYICFMPVYQRHQYEQELLIAKQAAEDALLANQALITLQKQLEQRQAEGDRQVTLLQQQNDELAQFGKIIAHDLQEPLRKITLLTSTLEREPSDTWSPVGKRGLHGLSRASTRLRHLINDLQLYFTPASPTPAAGSVDLTELIEEIVQGYNLADVHFSWTSLPRVVGYRQELISLFSHLLDNAVKFRRSNIDALIHISGHVVSQNSYRSTPGKYRYIDHARIVVSDNGIGFSHQYREDIFRLLKKVDPYSPGLGLGLPLAKKIVERHHGLITAESVVGQRTEFIVVLPMA